MFPLGPALIRPRYQAGNTENQPILFAAALGNNSTFGFFLDFLKGKSKIPHMVQENTEDLLAGVDFNKMFFTGEILDDIYAGAKDWSFRHLNLLTKLGLAAPAALFLLSSFSGNAEASGLPQGNNPFIFPVEFGRGAFAGFLENCVNKPVDTTGLLSVIGGVIGTLRLLPQVSGAWAQLTKAPEGQDANYTAALTRLGGLFYTNTLQESLQYARIPLLVSSTYWLNHMAEFAPAEIAGMFRMTALVMAGVTFVSTLEAVDPFH
jgi:hypothetical protein